MIQSIQIVTVALTVAQEAGGEIQVGKLAVAYVIKNRSDLYGMSYSDVCLKPYQFSCWNTESSTRMNIDQISEQTWAQCLVAALQAMYRLVPDPTHGALYYLNEEEVIQQAGTLPTWWHLDTSAESEIKIGNHTFRGPKNITQEV